MTKRALAVLERNRLTSQTNGFPRSFASKRVRPKIKSGMPCPACQHESTAVIDSRCAENGQIRRRRCCVACNYRFTTYESVWKGDVLDFQI